VVPVGLALPKKIIQAIRDILDRSIVRGERIREKIVAKGLKDQQRALNERIGADQILIVPDNLPAQGWEARDDAADYESEDPKPSSLRIPSQLVAPGCGGRGLGEIRI
jgi:hypothetical protein